MEFKRLSSLITDTLPAKVIGTHKTLRLNYSQVLYGLKMQILNGDNQSERPSGLLDLVGKRKWDAWEDEKGKSKEEAILLYI